MAAARAAKKMPRWAGLSLRGLLPAQRGARRPAAHIRVNTTARRRNPARAQHLLAARRDRAANNAGRRQIGFAAGPEASRRSRSPRATGHHRPDHDRRNEPAQHRSESLRNRDRRSPETGLVRPGDNQRVRGLASAAGRMARRFAGSRSAISRAARDESGDRGGLEQHDRRQLDRRRCGRYTARRIGRHRRQGSRGGNSNTIGGDTATDRNVVVNSSAGSGGERHDHLQARPRISPVKEHRFSATTSESSATDDGRRKRGLRNQGRRGDGHDDRRSSPGRRERTGGRRQMHILLGEQVSGTGRLAKTTVQNNVSSCLPKADETRRAFPPPSRSRTEDEHDRRQHDREDGPGHQHLRFARQHDHQQPDRVEHRQTRRVRLRRRRPGIPG